MVLILRSWIFIIAPIGSFGNFITALTIIHQFILHGRRRSPVVISGQTSSIRSRPPVSATPRASITMYDFKNNPRHISISSPPGSRHGSCKSPCTRTPSTPNKTYRSSLLRLEADTLLILHLTLCDLIYCSVSLPHTSYVYAFRSNGEERPFMCEAAAFFRYVNAYAEWLTLGTLTVQRCVDMTRLPAARFFRIKSTAVSIVGIWVFSVVLQITNLLRNNYGYNPVTRKCDILATSRTNLVHFYTIETFIPCSLMMFGCISIIIQMIKNKKRLQRSHLSSHMLRNRDREMFQLTILVLCLLLLFLFSVIPICIFNVLFALNVTHSMKLSVVAYMMYWVQYGINFIVYAASHSKYRLAYKLFLGEALSRVKNLLGVRGSTLDIPTVVTDSEESDSVVHSSNPMGSVVAVRALNGRGSSPVVQLEVKN